MIQALKEQYGEHNAYAKEEKREPIRGRYPCSRCIFSAGFSIGLITLGILFAFYFSILLAQLYSFEACKDIDPHDVINHFTWTIIQASIGFKLHFGQEQSWPLITAIQVCLIVQLVSHIPFIYYVSKEYFSLGLDEYKTGNLSNMVRRVRTEEGDPRVYLVQYKKRKQEDKKRKVILHRQPFMMLPQRTKLAVNSILIIIVVLLTIFD